MEFSIVMMVMAITGIIMAVALVAIVVVVLSVIKKAKRVSRSVLGTDSLVQGFAQQQKELAETPKSVAGMTRIYLPQIQKDFPEFHWEQFRDRAVQQLKAAFASITEEDLSLLEDASPGFQEQVRRQIQENQQQGIRETYRGVEVHRTEIARYEKHAGTCTITLQSAVGHIHYKEKDGKICEGSKELPGQTKYNIQLMYIQDPELAAQDHAIGITCPNCGAPVTKLGSKFCEYCGSGVIPVNLQVWSVANYCETDYFCGS